MEGIAQVRNGEEGCFKNKSAPLLKWVSRRAIWRRGIGHRVRRLPNCYRSKKELSRQTLSAEAFLVFSSPLEEGAVGVSYVGWKKREGRSALIPQMVNYLGGGCCKDA